MTDKLLSRKETWTRLGISMSSFNRLVATGQIKVHRIGHLVKITESDLQDYLDRVAHGEQIAKN